MPRYVYSADTALKTEDDVKKAIPRPTEPNLLYPFILRCDQLHCFNEPGNSENPFLAFAKDGRWQRRESREWWCHEDRLLWFQDLLGRSLNKLTGRRGLMLDKNHRRYYFPPNESAGEHVQSRKVRYKPLNRKTSERSAVWQPVRRKTGEKRPYWYHLAASLAFRRVAADSWVLCIRPEYRVTTDGFIPYEAEAIGSVVTRKRAHAFNNDLLEDLQFWRSYLSDGKPTIVLWFGGAQQILISSSMLEGTVCWPGMPDQYKLQFQNVDFDEDLFSLAERQALDEEYDEELSEEGADEDAI